MDYDALMWRLNGATGVQHWPPEWFGNDTMARSQGLPVPLRIVWQADEDDVADAKLEEIGRTISLRDNLYGWVYRMPRADRDRREWLWIPASVWIELLSPDRDAAPNEASLHRQVESVIRSHGITTRQLRARLPFIEARDTGNRSFPIPTNGSILDILDNPERK